jgi:hypothetical protein
MTLALRLSLAAAALLALAGCESTVDAARKLASEGKAVFQQKGIDVGRQDRQLRILGTSVLTDSNGTAVVVSVRNSGTRAIVDAPISIDVLSTGGASVFRNNSPGLEEDLAHVPLLLPRHVFDWVNDQVLATGKPARVDVRIGSARAAPASLPTIRISNVQLTADPVSGLAATGHVLNDSKIDQQHLVLFAVARRAGKIVAAGRAIVTRLAAGKSAVFHAYFIGNPKGAQISVSAPPSVIR